MNGLKEVFKYSALGVALLFALYIIYNLTTNHLNHNTEALIELKTTVESKADTQIKILEKIEQKL